MNYAMMIKPASGHCNLRCKYCFYMDECNNRTASTTGIMSNQDATNLVRIVLNQLTDDDTMHFAFQGGEPTLAGLDFFRTFVEAVHAHRLRKAVSFAIQTNGFTIDDAWANFFSKHHFLVGLSLDGPQHYHDSNRVDLNGRGTFQHILHAKNLFVKHGVSYNILTVLTDQIARHPQEIWNFLHKFDIQYIQFVPCLAELDGADPNRSSLSPMRFASFYTTLLPLWAKALYSGQYISIKFFDDLFNLVLNHNCTACGLTGRCTIQLIIEANGDVYPCDFYALDEWKLGNIYTAPLETLLHSSLGETFVERPRTTSLLCESCSFHNICGGGCPRMQRSMYLNDTVSMCGYKTFLENCRDEIDRIAQFLVHSKM